MKKGVSSRNQTVIVIGAGIAGLTALHQFRIFHILRPSCVSSSKTDVFRRFDDMKCSLCNDYKKYNSLFLS